MKIFAVLFILAAAGVQAAPHRRAASHDSGCELAVAPRRVEIPASGGSVSISVGATGSCSWASRPSDAWIVTSDGTSSVTITLGSTTRARSGSVDIGGFTVTVVQDGIPNLVINGNFDHDLSGWTTIYSTGTGTIRWIASDADGSPASGAAAVTSTQALAGYQLVQCVDVTPGATYDFGVSVRIPANQDASGAAYFGVYELTVPDCTNTSYTASHVTRVTGAAQWTQLTATAALQSSTQSLLFVLGAGGEKQPPYEVDWDDAYVRGH